MHCLLLALPLASALHAAAPALPSRHALRCAPRCPPAALQTYAGREFDESVPGNRSPGQRVETFVAKATATVVLAGMGARAASAGGYALAAAAAAAAVAAPTAAVECGLICLLLVACGVAKYWPFSVVTWCIGAGGLMQVLFRLVVRYERWRGSRRRPSPRYGRVLTREPGAPPPRPPLYERWGSSERLPAQERPERVAPDETEDAGLLALVLASLAAMIGFAAPFGGF